MNLSLMFYGEPGMGKTVLACTAVDYDKTAPVLMLDCECNVWSVQSKMNDITFADLGKKNQKGKIDRLRIENTNEFEAIINWLLNNKFYKTVIIDSITQINYMALSELASFGKVRKGFLHVIPIEIQHYGFNILLIKQLVEAFKLFDGVVIYTALEDIDKIEGELLYRVRPDFPGKLSREVMAKMHIVGRMSIKSGVNVREIRFQPDSRVIAKDQSENGKLGLTMDNPTITKIMEKLNA